MDYLLTVNRRLARTLKAERARGLGFAATYSGRIIAWDDFLHELFAYQRCQTTPAWQLSSQQEQMLWARAMQDFPTLGFAHERTIQSARDAYGLVKAYQLQTSALTGHKEDADLFAHAIVEFEKACDELGAFPAAALIQQLLKDTGFIKTLSFKKCDCYGFDEWTPAQSALITALEENGIIVTILPQMMRDSGVRIVAATDAREELYQAALYAKEAVTRDETVAIVVPQLQREWHAVSRQLAEVFQSNVPYNISSGESLDKQPIIHVLLETLKCLKTNTTMLTWTTLLHSPFIAGGVSEASLRALFDLRLCKYEALSLSLSDVATQPVIPPLFLAQLNAVKQMKPGIFMPRSMRAWVIFLKEWIALWGWGGDRVLSSAEYQAIDMFYDILPSLYHLDVLSEETTFHDFQHALITLTKETLFQTETQDKPIQVLGLLEAAGLTFDHVWIVGLTADTYPGKATPHPFIPTPIQIPLDMPHSSPEREVRVATRLLERLVKGAQHVTLSYALHDSQGEVQLASPLIARYGTELALPPAPMRLGECIAMRSDFESYEDDRGVPLLGLSLKGGSSLLKDQSACPHAAYLKHRLMARAPQKSVMGLSARAQGNLLHAALERIWTDINSRDALIALDTEHLHQTVLKHIDAVLDAYQPTLSISNKLIESKRLLDVLLHWLAYEKSRSDFTVIALENKINVTLGSLTLTLKMDRVDAIGTDQTLIIDYKTGNTRIDAWNPPRMDEPQLPLYAVSMNPPPTAIAYAQMKKNKMGLETLGNDGEWPAMLDAFRKDLNYLAAEIIAGNAETQPKYGDKTCDKCDLAPGCRLHTGGIHEG